MSEYRKHNKVTYLTQYHFIWCPKYRKKFLVNQVRDNLKDVIDEVCAEMGSELKALEIMPDHVHMFASLDYRVSPSMFIRKVKGRSSNILRGKFPHLLKVPTLWSRSYFISSIGTISEDTIKQYIEHQWIK